MQEHPSLEILLKYFDAHYPTMDQQAAGAQAPVLLVPTTDGVKQLRSRRTTASTRETLVALRSSPLAWRWSWNVPSRSR